MQYQWLQGTSDEVFVVFHGTGGNEDSLLYLTGELNPQASVLSFLGNVGIGQGRRFFAPLLAGQRVNRVELAERVQAFGELWQEVVQRFELAAKRVTFIGYSNGANFILALLERYSNLAEQIILLHPAHLGWRFNQAPQAKILATVGANDYMTPAGQVVQLQKELDALGTQMDILLLDSGHEVTEQELTKLKQKVGN